MEPHARRKLLRRLVVMAVIAGLAAGGAVMLRERLNAPDPLDPNFVQCHAELQLATFAFQRQEEKGAVVRAQILRNHGMDTTQYRAYMVALEASPAKWNRFADQLAARYDTLQGIVVSRTPPPDLGKRAAPMSSDGRVGKSGDSPSSAGAISSAPAPEGVPGERPTLPQAAQPGATPVAEPAAGPALQKDRPGKPKVPRIPIRWGRRSAEDSP